MVVKAISKANVVELEDIGLGKMILMMEVTKSNLEAIRVSLEFEDLEFLVCSVVEVGSNKEMDARLGFKAYATSFRANNVSGQRPT